MFFPEAHLPGAGAALDGSGAIRLGCQGVYREDTAPGGNFGAFTTNRTANAAAELGCESALIGHCEERADKAGVLAEAGVTDAGAVNRLLNREVLAAQKAGFRCFTASAKKRRSSPAGRPCWPSSYKSA
jgi:triosephosphate isomerase